MVERIRKRRAFADPELNQVNDVTLLNAAAVGHIIQPAFYEYDSIPASLKTSYSLTYHTQNLINCASDLPIVSCNTNSTTSPLPSLKTEDNVGLQTPISKKPKLSFSIEAIMGFK